MKRIVLLFGGLLMISACAHKAHVSDIAGAPNGAEVPEITRSEANIKPNPKSKITGLVQITKTESGVLVAADLKGFKKNSTHGFHIHENGDCSSVDFKSAGGHYNPMSKPHGDPGTAMDHHAGDLGNLTADKKGNVKFEKEFKGLSLNGAMNPILGKSLVIHAKADDLKSQPAGDSGDRVACGVIEASH